MIETKTCINVYSELNTWIDFCVVIGMYEDFNKAEDIIHNAYDDWFSNETDEPIADYICRLLCENDVEFEIYFKSDEELSWWT